MIASSDQILLLVLRHLPELLPESPRFRGEIFPLRNRIAPVSVSGPSIPPDEPSFLVHYRQEIHWAHFAPFQIFFGLIFQESIIMRCTTLAISVVLRLKVIGLLRFVDLCEQIVYNQFLCLGRRGARPFSGA
jgi:hypothetical protein